ncbi:AAA family ATPase [Nocardioides limicola]|uniref:AAA family ATPase n=1 Tax=Nocardioides limicola TaxID=2803368 RepID=UPI00193C48DA|nr:SMC family ATPase [Nocardioides sp. DJM-14]
MRLHRLEITAFGPFADTVEVDFDELSDAGLFLLSGPTGAGKTSVLDAVCFALYGDVPGDRGAARSLRCQLAPIGRAPRVELDLSIGDRRFTFTRSPAWDRPKKRGTGTTTEHAKAVVHELVAGEQVHLTSRLDEAGHLITELLGMTRTQFTQVALLPQGRFQDFLSSGPDERQALLATLFRTRRFERVEGWLRDHRTTLRREADLARQRIQNLVARVSETMAEPPVEVESADEVRDWLAALEEAAATTTARVGEEAGRAHAVLTEARSELATARELSERQLRHATALRDLADLEAAADQIDQVRERLLEAERAQPVAASLRLLDRTSAREQHDRSALTTAAVEAGLCATAVTDEIDEAAAAAVARVNALHGLLPVSERRDQDLATLASVDADLERTSTALAAAEATLATLPDQVASARAEVAAAQHATAQLATLTTERDRLQTRLSAQAELVELRQRHAELTAVLDEASIAHDRLREEWEALRVRRLATAATELAGHLVVGGACPVCGSCEHPQPAADVADTDAGDEKALRRRIDDAELTRTAARDTLAAHEHAISVAASTAGEEPHDQVARAYDDLVAQLADATALAADATPRLERLHHALEQATTLQAEVGSLHADLARLTEDRTALTRRVAEATAQIVALLGTDGDPADELAQATAAADLLQRALTAARGWDRSVQDLDAARGDVDDAVTASGFTDVAAARAALLPDETRAAWLAQVREHDRRLAAVTSVVDDPALLTAAAQPAPDLTAHDEAVALAEADHAAADAARRTAEDRSRRLTELAAELADELRRWEPLLAQWAVSQRVAALAEGKGADNTWQMRLSAYVLAWRLGQVVDAANLRLRRMSDGRYSLQHSTTRGARESRGGLSLRVVDEWSGLSREPMTLSGGELFVVSLALALGLTDVVSHETGGVEIGTLFVDEGFGSLDADTLDDVMDTLDTLRDGGRVVGVVSHVAEMRDRIPTQVQISKGRSGSTLACVRGLGSPL